MKKRISVIAVVVALSSAGCGGGSKEAEVPGIGPDASQSVVSDVEYRLVEVSQNCPPDLSQLTSIFVGQNQESLTIKVGEETIATGTIDSSSKVTLTLPSDLETHQSIACTGIYNEGTVDLACLVAPDQSCDVAYTRVDLL